MSPTKKLWLKTEALPNDGKMYPLQTGYTAQHHAGDNLHCAQLMIFSDGICWRKRFVKGRWHRAEQVANSGKENV